MGCVLCAGFDEQGSERLPKPCQAAIGESCTACVKLNELEIEISKVRHTLEDLLEKHRQTRTIINQAHDPIILRVPHEVASLIFRSCYPQLTVPPPSTAILPEDFEAQVKARLTLGAVCHEWRQIAWSTPQLWTELTVNLGSDFPWITEFIGRWLHRSGALPLSISICGPPEDWNRAPYPRSMELIHLLNTVSDRWGILKLKNTMTGFFRLLRGNGSSKSILRGLLVEASGWPLDPITKVELHNATLAPSHLVLHSAHLDIVAIAWDKLTSVEMRMRLAEDYYTLLRRAPNIQNLTLDMMDRGAQPALALIRHDQLIQLHVHYYQCHCIGTFLDSLAFPRLETLIMSDDISPFPFEVVESLLERSSCQLKDLTIGGAQISGPEIVDFLLHIPSLEGLSLAPLENSEDFPDVLFTQMASSDLYLSSNSSNSEVPFLPRLRSFEYDTRDRYSNETFPWHQIPRFFGPLDKIESRLRPLEHVEICFRHVHNDAFPLVVDPTCHPDFLAILEAGFKVKIVDSLEARDLLVDIHKLVERRKVVRISYA